MTATNPPPLPPPPGRGAVALSQPGFLQRKTGCRRLLIGSVLAVAVLVVLAVVAGFLIDRRLNPPVDAPDLDPITLPQGEGLEPGRVVFDTNRTGTFEVFTMNADGGDLVQLTDDPGTDAWWARLSPDRTRILFYRTPAGTHDRDFSQTSLWMMAADGSEAIEVLPPGAHGWNQHGHAEWSPDGAQLTMFGGKNTNPSIWVTSADGREIRPVATQPGTNVDPSWSPDGSTIVYIGCPQRVCLPSAQEVYTVSAEGGDRTRLTHDGVRDHDPYYSPDGTRIALLSQTAKPTEEAVVGSWNIRMVDAGGGDAVRVTDDDQVNSMPKWTPDGQRIYYHRFVYGSGRGFDVWSIGADGSDPVEVLATEFDEEYPEPQ